MWKLYYVLYITRSIIIPFLRKVQGIRNDDQSLSPVTPLDIFLPNWQRGQPAAMDVTVISTLQQSTLQGATSTQGHALVVGAERKLAAHVVACRAAGIAFVPLVVESLGGWSNEAADTITKIGRRQGQRLGVPPAESIRHLFQRCAIALWRGNASM